MLFPHNITQPSEGSLPYIRSISSKDYTIMQKMPSLHYCISSTLFPHIIYRCSIFAILRLSLKVEDRSEVEEVLEWTYNWHDFYYSFFLISYTLKVVIEAHSVKPFICLIFRPVAKLQADYMLYTQFAIVRLTFCKMLNTVPDIRHVIQN